MKKRMVAAEQKALLELHAIVAQSAFVEQGLERRIGEIKGAKGWLHSAQSLMTKLANELVLTLPDEQRKHMGRQLAGLYMHVGVKDKISQQKRDADHGRLLSFKELEVVATAIRECCKMCSIEDPQQQKMCPFCKLMDTLPVDKPDENARGCGYYTLWI